jgi:hypothetical protein
MSGGLHRKKQPRRSKQPFVMLHWYLLDSRAWHQLSMVARAAYIEVARCYFGENNGRIVLSARTLASRLPCNKTTAAKALRALEDAGFIETMKMGSFTRKDRRASEYRLTNFRCDVTHDLPSRKFNPSDRWLGTVPSNRTSQSNQPGQGND